MRAGALVAVAGLLFWNGCAPRNPTIASAFPRAAEAAPWRLDGEVWTGSFEEAAAALGDDASACSQFAPARVWLAVYRHESSPDATLTARIFSFDSPDAARHAFEHFRPLDAVAFHAGDAGCWTEIGVLFVRGRLVFDIFGQEPSLQSEIEAARLTGILEKRLPADLAAAPR